jgi:putative sigma-54 modulation protein
MAVQVEIKVRNLELSDRLNEYVTKKVAKLDRYLDTLEEAKVDLSYIKSARSASDRQVAQLTVRGRGGVVLRAEERTDDIFGSVDAVLEKIYRQIERYKGRRWRNRGDGRPASEAASEAAPVEPETPAARAAIARRKSFELTPMDEEEALEQMALLGHEDFFVFLNAGTNQINVLYRRRDGTYGLIEPEVR